MQVVLANQKRRFTWSPTDCLSGGSERNKVGVRDYINGVKMLKRKQHVRLLVSLGKNYIFFFFFLFFFCCYQVRYNFIFFFLVSALLPGVN